MTEKVFTITDEAGMHARPSSLLVKAVTPFKSEVFIEYKGKRVKSEIDNGCYVTRYSLWGKCECDCEWRKKKKKNTIIMEGES